MKKSLKKFLYEKIEKIGDLEVVLNNQLKDEDEIQFIEEIVIHVVEKTSQTLEDDE